MRKFIISFLAVISLLAGHAQAALSVGEVEQAIADFKQSPNSEFAPATISKAQAYWGAAQLVAGDAEEAEKRLQAAVDALAEARRLARDFRQQHAEVLELRRAAGEAVDDANEPALKTADEAMLALIQANEAGRLNEKEALAQQAAAAYRNIISDWLPRIRDETVAVLSRAAAAGAKSYAPRTYSAAKDALAGLRAYIDGIIQKMPSHPRQSLQYAQKSLELTQSVKQWRRDAGSHEELVLQVRDEHLRLAEALGLAIDRHDPGTDVDVDLLIAEIDKLKASLVAARQRHDMEIAELTRRHNEELRAQLEAQRQMLQQQQAEQVAKLKQALQLKMERKVAEINAQLERETFEQKRQARVRGLFKKDEVDILANVDGSLLIRLKALGFAPNRSDVDARYFDLLSRLKEALDIYAERKVRIEGHTDNVGEVKYNQTLSLKRAEAVRDYLVASGVDGQRLTALGYGEVRPIASNEFDKGRAMNRRIDVVIEAAHGN